MQRPVIVLENVPVPAPQPHLRKCFEAIETLDFGPGGEISGMNSREKEKVPFDKAMVPTSNVEIWLGEYAVGRSVGWWVGQHWLVGRHWQSHGACQHRGHSADG